MSYSNTVEQLGAYFETLPIPNQTITDSDTMKFAITYRSSDGEEQTTVHEMRVSSPSQLLRRLEVVIRESSFSETMVRSLSGFEILGNEMYVEGHSPMGLAQNYYFRVTPENETAERILLAAYVGSMV